MKLSEFARLVGASKQAVSQACAAGRMTQSVTRDGRGRVVDVEPERGVLEWQEAHLPKHFEAAEARLRLSDRIRRATPRVDDSAPCLVFGGLDAIERQGAPFIGIRIPLDRFLAGAAAALREAGQEATPGKLRGIVESMGEDEWWMAALASLEAALDATVPAVALPTMWEAEGRDAVLATKQGGVDGNA